MRQHMNDRIIYQLFALEDDRAGLLRAYIIELSQ